MDNRYISYGGKWVSSPAQHATNPQDDEMGSAMTEELTSSGIQYGSKGQLQEPVSFLDWSSGSTGRKTMESRGGLERMGSGMSVVSGFGGDLEAQQPGEELRKCSILDQGKLPSSQYKGVVPQPNGRWGAQIYEKHQRVWLGTFNREEDAAKAYDRAALKFRGREAITNFRPIKDEDPEAHFMNKCTKAEIVDMLRKHTYDQQLHHHSKDSSSMALLQNVQDEEIRPVYQANSSSPDPSPPPVGNSGFSSSDDCRDHLFDKAVTPSDVGKLNRLVIPKQHAEKYFPMDVSSSEKGLLLNFEDNGGKSWRFRYSYWNSSQSYVLTKGWSRFVKEKKLQAGDIVSFHRGSPNSPRPHQLYITWRRRPCGQQTQSFQSKGLFPLAYGSLNTFYPSQNLSISSYNPQWTHIFWPNSESPLDAAIWPHGSPAIPFYYPAKQPEIPVLINIADPTSSSGYGPVSLQNLQEKKELEVPSSSDPDTKSKGVRLFGVNLAEPPTMPGELILFP